MFKNSSLILFFLLASTFQTQAQQIDSTFGTNGIQQITFGEFPSYFSAMEVQSDEKILTLAFNTQILNPVFLSRQLPDGSVDESFGINGKVQTSFGFQYCETYDIVQLDDNKILIAGTADGKSALMKFLENGTVDSSFGANGRVIFSFGPSVGSKIRSLLLVENDMFLAIGEAYNYDNTSFDMAVIRFLSNGAVDSSFGTSGFVKVDVQGYNDFGNCGALMPDGKIVVAGGAMDNQNTLNFALIQLTSNGSLDPTFGNAGRVVRTINSGYTETIDNIQILNDQSILVVGSSGGDFALLKFNNQGNTSQEFGNQGVALVDFDDYQDKAFEILVDNQNRILLGGYGSSSALGGLFHAALARFTPTGQPDNTFDGDGKWINTFGQNQSEIYGMSFLTTGKILLAGTNIPMGSNDVQPFLARLNAEEPASFNFQDVSSNLLYPNPCKTELNVNKESLNAAYSIFDITGKCVQKGTLQNTNIQLNDLPNGTYWICIKTLNYTHPQKFILIH